MGKNVEWTQEKFFENSIWYHATTAISAKNIVNRGVIADINKNAQLDFGYGFYLCPNYEWAKNYLYGLLGLTEEDEIVEPNDGYILEFEFKPVDYVYEEKYKFFSDLDETLARFIFRNRMYYKLHFIRRCVHNYSRDFCCRKKIGSCYCIVKKCVIS